jgi:hypothetical protein
MKSAISVGGEILKVDVVRTAAGYEASCAARVLGSVQRLTGSGETYDDALVTLRNAVLKSRQCV